MLHAFMAGVSAIALHDDHVIGDRVAVLHQIPSPAAAGLLLKATDDVFGVADALIALTELVVLVVEVAMGIGGDISSATLNPEQRASKCFMLVNL